MSAIDSRVDLIEEIRAINRAASESFLRAFTYESLLDYLDHLRLTTEPRDVESRWVRRGDDRAVFTRSRPDY